MLKINFVNKTLKIETFLDWPKWTLRLLVKAIIYFITSE